jgi:uncharacterized protein (TIGR03083 family)
MMTMMTMMTSNAAAPRESALPRDLAMRIAATEYQRVAAAVAELSADEWALPTDCPAWSVGELVAHVVGMASMASSPLKERRQRKAAVTRMRQTSHRGPFIDALTAHQVGLFKGRPRDELVELVSTIGAKAARGRKRTPGFVRRRLLPVPQVVNGAAEQWTVGYLVDTILTRDPWMHRIDLAQATKRQLQLTPDHDGVIVADVVEEWAGRHGRPYHLALTGPAGGFWSSGVADEADHLSLDAIEFCRIVSGRGDGPGLLGTQVPF